MAAGDRLAGDRRQLATGHVDKYLLSRYGGGTFARYRVHLFRSQRRGLMRNFVLVQVAATAAAASSKAAFRLVSVN